MVVLSFYGTFLKKESGIYSKFGLERFRNLRINTGYEQISCTCLHTNEGWKSKNKGFSVEYASKFLELFSVGKKCALYTGKYGMLPC